MKEEDFFGTLYNEMDEYVELRANNSIQRKEMINETNYITKFLEN